MAAALAAGSAGMLAEIRNKTDTLIGTRLLPWPWCRRAERPA